MACELQLVYLTASKYDSNQKNMNKIRVMLVNLKKVLIKAGCNQEASLMKKE